MVAGASPTKASNNLSLLTTSFNYPEPPPPIRCCLGRCGRLDRQHRVEKIADRPGPLGNADRNSRGRFQCLVLAAQIVVGHVERHGRTVIVQLLRERIGEARKAAGAHAHREIAALHVARANLLRHTAYDGVG
jgi:hypothetical protein